MIDFTVSDLLVDMHTHTLRTVGGASTIRENFALARRRGLNFLTVVDHITTCDAADFISMSNLKTDAGVHIISGINLNTMGIDELYQQTIDKVKPKFLTLSLNPQLEDKMVSSERFIELINDALNYYGVAYLCDITKYTAAHIPSAEHRRFSSLFAELCTKRMLTIEIPSGQMSDAELFMLTKILEDCEGKNVNYAFGSGALYCERIGEVEEAVLFAENFTIPKERVLNCDREMLNRLSNDYDPPA